MADFIDSSFREAQSVLEKFVSQSENLASVEKAVAMMVETFRNKGKIFSCGNGGSLCDAMHFAEELSGKYRQERPSLPALAIADPAYLSCVANDFGYQFVFSRFLEGMAGEGDLLLAISTSGNSSNVVCAVRAAQKQKLKTIALLGRDGGRLKDMVDLSIIVPSKATERIQEIHIKIIHTLIEGIERSLFPEQYQ